jgi:hypothetical protein
MKNASEVINILLPLIQSNIPNQNEIGVEVLRHLGKEVSTDDVNHLVFSAIQHNERPEILNTIFMAILTAWPEKYTDISNEVLRNFLCVDAGKIAIPYVIALMQCSSHIIMDWTPDTEKHPRDILNQILERMLGYPAFCEESDLLNNIMSGRLSNATATFVKNTNINDLLLSLQEKEKSLKYLSRLPRCSLAWKIINDLFIKIFNQHSLEEQAKALSS